MKISGEIWTCYHFVVTEMFEQKILKIKVKSNRKFYKSTVVSELHLHSSAKISSTEIVPREGFIRPKKMRPKIFSPKDHET